MLEKATSNWIVADPIKAAFNFIMKRDIFPLTVRKLLGLQAVLTPAAMPTTHPAISRFCEHLNQWMSDYAREKPSFGIVEKVIGIRVTCIDLRPCVKMSF